MADPHRGKELFAQRVEYPLPKKAGTKDYVFYFVPQGDGYRDAGEKFFARFYKGHVAKNVRTLEELIDVLAAEVDGGVTRIREIVLLAHGNALGLLFPVVNGVSATNRREYKYLTAFSLACLQKDFEADKFPSFEAKRTKVLGKLGDDSWVTIRACNFGRTREGMYSVYAFFGGKANVWCPIQYQFFGTPPITTGMRLETPLEVHEHLVRQHFLPKDAHTLERKNAYVTAMVDKGKFSTPFEIARMRMEDPTPDQIAAYEPLIDQLNKRSVSAPLRAAFEANEFPLPPNPRVEVKDVNRQWTIIDRSFPHDNGTVIIRYDVYESVESDDGNREVAVLRAGASIDNKPSARESIPIQLFLNEEQNDTFRGKVLRLAGYIDDPLEPADKARFDAVRAALEQGTLAAGGVDIEADLENETKVDLAPGTKPVRVSATGPADAQRITWSLSDGQNRFKIMLEHRTNPDGQPAHTITVYADHADQRERIMEEYRSIAYTGTDTDSPGTELAASLDQLSLEDLLNVLEHLRSPYKPTHAYYLQHVQAALARKKAFRQWMIDNVPIDTSSVLATDPYTQLSRSEDQDYSALSYPCVFSSVWAEVKMSNPPKKPIITDLFAEDDLAAKFKIVPEAIANRGEVPDLDSDSPATDIEALRALERVGFEPLFEADKNVVEIVPKADPAPLSCAEFEAVIAKWMEVKDLSPDGIREALEAVKVADGKTAWDVVSGFKTHVKGWLKILTVDVPALDLVVMTKKDFFKLVGKKVPFLARLTTLQTFISIEFVFTIPFEMWMDFAEAQVQTSQVWYLKGRVTAFRQWLREPAIWPDSRVPTSRARSRST